MCHRRMFDLFVCLQSGTKSVSRFIVGRWVGLCFCGGAVGVENVRLPWTEDVAHRPIECMQLSRTLVEDGNAFL